MRIATMVCNALALALASLSGDARPGVDQLDWMVGHWCSDSDDTRIEELWLPSPGDLMLGLNRTVAGDRTSAFEYLRIVVDADQRASYVAQPGGRPPTAFQLTKAGESWVRFENPEHDFPQRIEYRRNGHALSAQISGPGADGAVVSIPFEFTLCGP